MEEYVVRYFPNETFVYREQEEILVIHQHQSLSGKKVFSFREKGELIVETQYLAGFFEIEINILTQVLPKEIKVERVQGKYCLRVGDNVLSLRKRHFKNPIYHLYCNNERRGEVYDANFNGLIQTPMAYKINFLNRDESNFYLLLFFLMTRSPGV